MFRIANQSKIFVGAYQLLVNQRLYNQWLASNSGCITIAGYTAGKRQPAAKLTNVGAFDPNSYSYILKQNLQ